MDTASRMLGNYYIMPRVRADMTNQTVDEISICCF